MLSRVLLCLCCFISSAAFAQQNDTISGSLIDQRTHEAIPFARVVVKGSDSITHTIDTDIDGRFTITGLSQGYYVLRASCGGYSPAALPGIVLNRSKITLSPIRLQPALNWLPEVTIVSYREPLIDRDTPPRRKHKRRRRE